MAASGHPVLRCALRRGLAGHPAAQDPFALAARRAVGHRDRRPEAEGRALAFAGDCIAGATRLRASGTTAPECNASCATNNLDLNYHQF